VFIGDLCSVAACAGRPRHIGMRVQLADLSDAAIDVADAENYELGMTIA
jgi:hypothetical protein